MEFLFTLSAIINAFLVWYIVQLLKRFLAFQEELEVFTAQLEEYEGHLEIVNNLERFYGDETLGNLVRHSKDIVKECKRFQNILLYNEEEDGSEEES
tara:strand:- start:93 stop:383 length:291 start_codon:yes stop_codon:yes gene_type:complete